MKKDINYIIKKIIIGVLVGFILFSLKSCNVKAYTNNVISGDVEFPTGNATFLSMNDNYRITNVGYRYFYGSTLNPSLYFASPTSTSVTCGTYGCGINIDGLSTVKDNYYAITIFLLGDSTPYWHYSYSALPKKVGVSSGFSTINSDYFVEPISGTTSLSRSCNSIYDNEYTGNCLYQWTVLFKAPRNGSSVQTWWSSNPSGGDPNSDSFFVGYNFNYVGDSSLQPDQLNTALNNVITTINNNINSSTQSIINNQNSSTQSIINNQNSSTQSIINNQNSSTQSIIDNQDANTQQQIESEIVCFDYTIQIDSSNRDNFTPGFLLNNGNISSNSIDVVSNYIAINKNTLYTFNYNYNGNLYRYCTYDNNKVLQNCFEYSSVQNYTTFFTTFDGYVRFTSRANSSYYTRFSGQYCGNGNQQISGQLTDVQDKQDTTNQHLEDISNALTDQNGPNLSGLSGSAGWLPAGPVDSILNLPLSLFNNLSTSLGNTCQPVELPVPLVNSTIILPCMTSVYNEIGISSWVNAIGVIASAFILFSYLAKLYKWVDDTLTFRENNHIDNWGGV